MVFRLQKCIIKFCLLFCQGNQGNLSLQKTCHTYSTPVILFYLKAIICLQKTTHKSYEHLLWYIYGPLFTASVPVHFMIKSNKNILQNISLCVSWNIGSLTNLNDMWMSMWKNFKQWIYPSHVIENADMSVYWNHHQTPLHECLFLQ